MADEEAGVLDVLTIIELAEGIAGPFAGKLFADYGARVIKIEHPGAGDKARKGEANARDAGAAFLYLNTNKESVALDYDTADGAALLQRLIRDADGVIDDQPSRRRDDLGLDAATLIHLAPRLVIAQVSPDGSAAKEGDQQAAYVDAYTANGRPAARAFVAACEAGIHTFTAMLAALWRAAQTEHGQVVDVAAFAAYASTDGLAGTFTPAGTPATPGAAVEVDGLRYPRGPFETPAAPWRLSPAPNLGEHTEAVLSEIVGVSPTDLAELREAGVI